MGSPCPPHWTFAARAAYFGDRMCGFCDHRNPAGARFCNDCASPLDLKPCKQCDAVNHQAATNCHRCGAAYPVLFSTEATPASSAAAWATPVDAAGAATVARPQFAASALRAGWSMLRPGQFLLAAIATTLIVVAYEAYRGNVATPDAMGVASQPVGALENDAAAKTSAMPVAVESKRVDPETTATLQAPIPADDAEATKRASVLERPVPVPATKRASAHQRPVPGPATKRGSANQRPAPERRAPAGTTPAAAHGLAAARAGAGIAQTGKASRPDSRRLMQVSLARCGGDLIARIVCDQRVRLRFCEGRWGEVPECASGVANEHGQ